MARHYVERSYETGRNGFHKIHPPVIVDTLRRTSPMICFTSPNNKEGYVRSEAFAEEVYSPRVNEYETRCPVTGEYYAPVTGKWGPVVVHDRPQKVNEFINKIQTEVNSSPARGGGMGPWGRAPNRELYHKNDYTVEHSMFTPPSGGGGARMHRPGRDSPMPSEMTASSEYSKESAMKATAGTNFAVGSPRYGVPTQMGPKRGMGLEAIESREAARRYANFDMPACPFEATETYTSTIDSKEAARRYEGTLV